MAIFGFVSKEDHVFPTGSESELQTGPLSMMLVSQFIS